MLRGAALAIMILAGACSPSNQPEAGQEESAAAKKTEAADQAPTVPRAAYTGNMKSLGFEPLSTNSTEGWVDSSTRWSSPKISVCLEKSTARYPTEVSWMKDALASSWEAHSAVDFTGFASCQPGSAGIHVAFADAGARTLGLGSEIDKKLSGLRVNPTFGSWNAWCAKNEALRESCFRANVVHEFGHALGFAHEQNRTDTPDTCTAGSQGSDGDLILTPWDPDSIMNYCNTQRMRDGGKLSAYDQASVAKFYGGPAM